MKTKAITLEKITQYVLIFIISAIMTMIGNCINTVTDGNPDTYVSILEGIPGLLILIAIAFAGNLLGWLVPKIPAVLWITIIGILLGMPYNTVTAPFVSEQVGKLGLLPPQIINRKIRPPGCGDKLENPAAGMQANLARSLQRLCMAPAQARLLKSRRQPSPGLPGHPPEACHIRP